MKQFALALTLLLLAATSHAAQKTILIIESYHEGYAWDASYLEGIRETLGDKYRLVSFEMDTKRLPKSLYQQQADLAWERYQELEPELVILGDDNALKLLGPRFEKTAIPVVFLGINRNPRDYVTMEKQITGVLERPIFSLAIGSIAEILSPPPESILVLFDNGTTSQASVVEAFKGKTSTEIAGVKVDLRLISNFALWQSTVSQAANSGYDAIVVGLYHTIVGADGKNISADEVMAWTSANAPLPPFGFWDFSVGPGRTIGGFVLYGKEQGITAAKMADRILQGEEPGEIRPVIGEKGQYLFSRSELARHKLELPAKIATKARLID